MSVHSDEKPLRGTQSVPKKRQYRRPEFVSYGRMRDVTAAGSGGDPEGAATNNMNKLMP
jgi:hypothetical protein